MRARTRFAVALAAVSVFAFAAAASAVGMLTLSASATKVTYPHSVRLTVAFPDAESATATILAMPVGASEWTTMTRMATTATPTVSVKPRVATAYKAWISDVLVSEPVTVSVAARLTKPKINGYVHRGHSYTVKGTMSPSERDATVTVSTYRMETVTVRRGNGHARRVATWVVHSTFEAPLRYKNTSLSTWSMKWKPLETGWWKVVVSHEDATHVKSMATTYKWVRR